MVERVGSRVSGKLSAALLVAACFLHNGPCFAVTDHRDNLDRALVVPDDATALLENPFDIVVADHETYDDNLFRLPNNVSDVYRVVGPGASREDHINNASVGLADQWSIGRQIVNISLDATENRFSRNTDLNNLSTNDKVLWTWQLGPQLSGEVGADYTKYLTDFVNTFYYHKDVYERSEYFGTGRYQLGPHWSVYGGVLDSTTSFSANATQSNDAHSKLAELGVDFATDAKNTIGAAYRYTDTRYPFNTVLDNVTFDPDYREDSERIIAKYVPSDKTVIDLSGGYIKREYPSGAVGSFSGDIWRAALQWQPTVKVQIVAEAWRQLQAYLTAETNYYVSKGFSVSPTWSVSEKVSIAIEASSEQQSYVGKSSIVDLGSGRRNHLTAESLLLTYKATRWLAADLSYTNSKRASNDDGFRFDDRTIKAGLTATFGNLP